MALFRRLFYWKPPDRLLEISERVYVFDCCFSTKILEEDKYRGYMGGIVAQLQDYFPEASFMVFNFREGDRRSQVSDILSDYNMTVMDYPQQYEGCPLLPLEMIHHFLRSSESWLSMEGQHNVLLMHCERGGWPVLAFMLAGLLLYRKHYNGEQKTLEMVYKQAPKELLHLLSPLNPQPSHMRYLQYIARRGGGSDWPPRDTPFTLESLILRVIPIFDREGGCRPIVRVYGQNPLTPANRSPKILFATPMTKKYLRHYKQAEGVPIKINCHCRVQGDVVVECIHMDGDLEREDVMFRVMFNTAFVQSNILTLNRDEIDVAWNAKDQFPKGFKAEVLFSDNDAVESDSSTEVIADDEDETEGASTEATEEFFEAEEIFNNADWQDGKRDLDSHMIRIKSSVDDGSHKTDIYYFSDDARSRSEARLETGNTEEDLKTIVTEKLTTMDDKIVNLEAPGMAAPAESRLETGNAKYDEGAATEKSIFLDNMTVVEEKIMLESSSILQDTKGIDFSVGEEENTLKIGNSKQDTEGIITFVRTTLDDSSWKLEAPTVVDEANGRSEKRDTKPCVDDIITRMQPALNDNIPSSGTLSMADEMRHNSETHDCKRDILSDVIQDETKLCHEARLGNRGMAEQTETRLGRSNVSCGDKILSRKSITLDYTIRYEEKNIVEVSNFKHEVKDIVTLAVEEKRPSGSFIFEEDADDIVTKRTTTLDSMSCNSDDSTLADEAKSRVEQSESHYNQENLIVRKKSALTEKNHSASEFDVSELESLFSAVVPKSDNSSKSEGRRKSLGSKSDKIHLIELRRANNTEIMLTKVRMPLSDLMSAVLALDDSILDVDQVENLIKFCPTKEEMELLKGYTNDKEKLGKCEQFFLELMKVPRVESKLRVFSFKNQFGSQVSDLRKSLKTVDSACEQMRSSVKLKEIMKKILFLGNTLNQGTARGSAIGFRLDSLLKLIDTRATNNRMTLMHYLCKVLAARSPHLLDFHRDLTSLEAASKIQLKSLAEEMQAIVKGLEKVELELNASENDGPVSEFFRKTLKEFTSVAGAEVRSLTTLYTAVGRNADALVLYFGEDPARCPFEQVISTLTNFVSMFRRAHQENCKQAEVEKKKVQKESEVEKFKASNRMSENQDRANSCSRQQRRRKLQIGEERMLVDL
ncbi:formin-like protein 5 isoform X3 [Phoenix dactylifera]|uniref:Formin-like protein n=1 Tax=Phoenix dactylifera TaxID=42345 RepID=A0A8B9B2K4_PHODC|nr:formin-like protein 5 isoform X3 [Phoenix dactylifera]